MRKRFAMAALVMQLWTVPLSAQDGGESTADKIDAYITREMKTRRIPGLALAVVENGKTTQKRAYGLASVETKTPIGTDSVFDLSSLTKPFTAAAVLMLVEEGKVKLDDPIATSFANSPETWKGITLRHLLTHSAGFQGMEAKGNPGDSDTQGILNWIQKTPLLFSPGERAQYSDQGYLLLGMIIEKASGQRYGEFIQKRIFDPLRMSDSLVRVDPSKVIKNRVASYGIRNENTEQQLRDWKIEVNSAFGIYSTVEDLARFDMALRGGKLLKQSSLDQMWTPAKLNDGHEAFIYGSLYGFGWFPGDFRGHRTVSHGGFTGTYLLHFRDDDLTVIVLTNLNYASGPHPIELAQGIVGLVKPEWPSESDAGKAAVSEAEARKVIEAFLKDPLADTAQETARILCDSLQKCHAVQIELSAKMIPWMSRNASAERKLLYYSYLAGNARAQLDKKAPEDDPLSGWQEVLRVYALLKRKNEKIEIAEVETLLALQKDGKLAEHLAGIRATSPRSVKVSFRNGETTLSGTLILPPGEGPHPAVAMVHGSGPESRRLFAPWASFFTSKGIAMLVYDKRGVGSSTGDWTRASLDDLAGDALAAVGALRAVPGIDPSRVGLGGISQAGWIIPIAATRSKDVAFAILLSAPAVSGRQQFLTRTRRMLEARGFPPEEVQKAVALAELFLDTGKDEKLRPALEAAIEKNQGEKWYDVNPLTLRGLDGAIPMVRGGMDSDSTANVEKMTCPVLAIWGDADTCVPPDENRPPMEAAFKKGGNTDVTFQVIPGADHALCIDGKLAPELLDTICRWILEIKLKECARK